MDTELKRMVMYCLLGILIINLYYCLTKFERVVTVTGIHTFGSFKLQPRLLNLVMDNNGIVYEIHDSIAIGHFDGANIFMKLKLNQTYQIEGYGCKIPGTDIYPNITKIKQA